ncbi:MAG: hypothetical protein K6G42_10315 [Lachnospiraceae bacterium]|nr:hypothetical protein [Lachnospiraceae bacterium]
MTEERRRELIKAQQGELNGVETYLTLANIVHNESDRKAFKILAADEGRHASVFKQMIWSITANMKTGQCGRLLRAVW